MNSRQLSFDERLKLFLAGNAEDYGDSIVKECCSDATYIEFLGFGGEGPVIKIANNALGRTEVLKIRAGEIDIESQERFFQSAKLLARISRSENSPFPQVYDARTRPPHIRMEYIKGKDLRRHIEESPDLNLFERLNILKKISEGVAFVNNEHIVHRDLKPANILIDQQGMVYLIDFGVAKSFLDTTLTRADKTLGTIDYSAPEQLTDAANVDQRADVYSFAKVMYFTITGDELFLSHNLPRELVMIFSKSTQQDRNRRHSSIELLWKDIEESYPEFNFSSSAIFRGGEEEVALSFICVNTLYGFNPGKVKKILQMSVLEWEGLMRLSKNYVLNLFGT